MTMHEGTARSTDPSGAAGSAAAVADKVRKLLAMAECTSNADEADAFSRKAAELIAAHRLDPTRLRDPVDDPLGVLEVALGRGAYVRARLALLQAVAEANGCRVVFRTGYAGTMALVAGFRSDLDTVEMLHTSLHAQAAGRMAAERRATGASTQQWRRSFLFGYADQVRRMLATTVDDATRRVAPDRSTVPALLAREAQVEAFMATEFGRVSSARRPTAATATGYTAGRQAAASADVGRRMVPAQRGLGRGS